MTIVPQAIQENSNESDVYKSGVLGRFDDKYVPRSFMRILRQRLQKIPLGEVGILTAANGEVQLAFSIENKSNANHEISISIVDAANNFDDPANLFMKNGLILSFYRKNLPADFKEVGLVLVALACQLGWESVNRVPFAQKDLVEMLIN